MTSSRVSVEASFVLHSRPYRDSSLIVDVFTKGFGRITVVAKGARRAKSKWRGLLQPFAPLLLSWSGKGDLFTLTGAELFNSPATLKQVNLAIGFYINELILRLLHRHDPHPGIFELYSSVIYELASSPLANKQYRNKIERALRLFEKEFLSDLGYGLILDCEVESGDSIVEDGFYHYEIEKGPVYANNSSVTGISISGSSLLSFNKNDLNDEVSLREVKQLTRSLITHHLDGKPLNSRSYLNSLCTVMSNNS